MQRFLCKDFYANKKKQPEKYNLLGLAKLILYDIFHILFQFVK